ncbi:MAG: 50S ribosomal protein L11 methyltransferase [Duncaniella sp.]|nr:50S ribosomal protein L11 methyltransferase [Duncaniella sp.]
MNDYVEIRLDVDPCSEVATDVLAAMLAEVGCESFLPDEKGLTAYIQKELYDAASISDAVASFPLDARVTLAGAEVVEGRDWNEEWEKNYFKPIVIGDRCVIHSTFHHDIPVCDYDIVIDPKMAFGTGHHATTSLIIRRLLDDVKSGMEVIDMGTGTGILAILSSMKGAKHVTAIEIDGWAYENACENMPLNHVENVTVVNGDASALAGVPAADLFIANINRNIITADLPRYVEAMKPGAEMLLSGFYEIDIPEVMKVAEPLGLKYEGHTVETGDWTCLKLKYDPS